MSFAVSTPRHDLLNERKGYSREMAKQIDGNFFLSLSHVKRCETPQMDCHLKLGPFNLLFFLTFLGESKRISRSKLLTENDSDLDNQKQFDLTCDIDGCQLKLRKESQLAAHVYKIHPDTQHPIRDAYLKCPNEGCFKVFPVRRLVTLNNHAKICPNLMIKTAKECSICLKTFSSVHNLKKHISGWKY